MFRLIGTHQYNKKLPKKIIKIESESMFQWNKISTQQILTGNSEGVLGLCACCFIHGDDRSCATLAHAALGEVLQDLQKLSGF